MATPHDFLFVGTHGHVIAVRKRTGRRVWATSLPNTGYGVASILYEDGQLFCAAGGHVFSLDPLNGDILWTNGLRGMGHGVVYLTTTKSNYSEAVMALLAQQEQDDTQTSHNAGMHGTF